MCKALRVIWLALFGALLAAPLWADDRILVQSTTSTANSGLYDHILPLFTAETGITAHIVAVGTGQAIRNARNCDGDVLLVHAKSEEEAFVADGFGTGRVDVMYNDYVIVGPKSDPAGLSGLGYAALALAQIGSMGALFTSRGDDSGTHKKELSLWAEAGVDPSLASGQWYRETGSGMGATLNVAIGMGAYALTDRATWIGFGNKHDFTIHVEGDAALYNPYGVIPINPAVCPNVNATGAHRFAAWLTSAAGQNAIAEFRVDDQQLFFPNTLVQQ